MGTMKDHLIHEFKHTGGGTMVATMESDDTYACECGAKMRVEGLTTDQHFAMPETIWVNDRPAPEAK